jgi:hypothetical protein
MGLIVVRRNEREPRYRCLCCDDAVFFEGEERAYESHIVSCSRRHDERMRAESWREKAPGIFDPFRSGDVELDRWIRQNRAMLLEGRKTL